MVVGPLALNLLTGDIESEGLGTLAELTLALLLFADAANVNLDVLKRFSGIPVRMLLIGLPLTILLGFGAGIVLFSGLTMLEIALLAKKFPEKLKELQSNWNKYADDVGVIKITTN